MAELLSRVNWVDLFALILLLRIGYVSSCIGVGKQILPLILSVLILVIILYNYSGIAYFLITRFSISPPLCIFLSYLFVTSLSFVIYGIIARITGFFLPQLEIAVMNVEKALGAVIGVTRAVIIIGLILIGFALAPFRPLENSVKNSCLAVFFINADLAIYTFTVNLILRGKNVSKANMLAEIFSEKDKYILESLDIKKRSRFYRKRIQ